MRIKATLVTFAYAMASSKRYKAYKTAVYEILEDPNAHGRRYFDAVMVFLVLSTILILIYEIKHTLPPIVYHFEAFAIMIFILEWLARLWVSSDVHQIVIKHYEIAEMAQKEFSLWSLFKEIITEKSKFIFSPMSIIDLLAIIPSYRPLRILRFFILFRLFKIFRYTHNMNYLLKVFLEKRFEFITLALIFSFLVFFASTVIYVFEGSGENKNINTFYDALYWAVVTVATVGYGDISPVTPEGRFATMLLIMSGLGIIAFTTSIVTTAMTEKLVQIKENNFFIHVSKIKNYVLVCGYGKMGKVFAHELSRVGEKFVIIDTDDVAVSKAQERGYKALRADASDSDVLEALNIAKNAKYILAVTGDDAMNLAIILSVKSIKPDLEVMVRIHDAKSAKKFQIAGASKTLYPYEISSVATIEYLTQPLAYTVTDAIMKEEGGVIIDEVEVFLEEDGAQNLPREFFISHKLKLLGITKHGGENEFIFNPKGAQIAVAHLDILMVLGYPEDIALFKANLIKRSAFV